MNAEFLLACTCGWTHEASTRQSATKWKAWHREQYRAAGSRASDNTAHVVTITRRAEQ